MELTHPLPVGTRVELTIPSKYATYRVFAVKPYEPNAKYNWYYTLVAEDWWPSKGIEVIDGKEFFHGAAQTEESIRILGPNAEEIYELLRLSDP